MNDVLGSSEAAVEAAVLDQLRSAPAPTPLAKIHKGMPKRTPAEAVERAVESLVAAGRAFRFAPYRSQAPRFWDRPHAEYARQVIREAIEKKPRTASDLDKAVQKPLADLSAARRKEIVGLLAAEGAVYQLPPLPGSRTVRYSASPPDPADYVRTAVSRFVRAETSVAKQLAPLGVSPSAVRQAVLTLLGENAPQGAAVVETTSRSGAGASPEEVGAAVLDMVRELARDPRLGGFISLPELRERLQSRMADKDRFDRVVCELARRQVVELYPHDYPGSLSDEERARLVTDERGAFYNGLSLRE